MIWQYLNKFKWILSIVVFHLIPLMGLANQPILTNIELFNQMLYEVVEEVNEIYNLDDVDTLNIHYIKDQNNLTNYIYERLIFELSKNREVFIFNQVENDNKNPILYLLPPMKAGVRYLQIHKNGFMKKASIEREAFIEIVCRYQVKNNPVQINEIKKNKVDIVPQNMKPYIEQQGMILGPIAIPEENQQNLIELSLAVIMSSIVVYLFYIIRSE